MKLNTFNGAEFDREHASEAAKISSAPAAKNPSKGLLKEINPGWAVIAIVAVFGIFGLIISWETLTYASAIIGCVIYLLMNAITFFMMNRFEIVDTHLEIVDVAESKRHTLFVYALTFIVCGILLVLSKLGFVE